MGSEEVGGGGRERSRSRQRLLGPLLGEAAAPGMNTAQPPGAPPHTGRNLCPESSKERSDLRRGIG